jgi:hypothetical protein
VPTFWRTTLRLVARRYLDFARFHGALCRVDLAANVA